MKRFLVTTSLKKTWPSSNTPILFIGEWCLLYSEKDNWGKLDFRVLPYHWDNRKKFADDFDYLKSLYEILLPQLANKLNDIHGVNHSIHYWRINLGPWLNYFIQVIYDRWFMLKAASESNEISSIKILKRKKGDLIPNDTSEFINFITNDDWNEMIYAEIFSLLKKSFKNITIHNIGLQRKSSSISYNLDVKKKLNKVLNFLSSLVCRNQEYFFISTYLSLKNEFFLNLKLKQLPRIWRRIDPQYYQYKNSFRLWNFSTGSIKKDEFVNILMSLIPKHIPKIYLEGYKNSLTTLKNSSWPSNPKGIFTSNSFAYDDLFKLWAADNIQHKVPLFIGQHGGLYGVALKSTMQDHQLDIADYFFSWGWSKSGYEKKIIPLGNLKTAGRKIYPKKNGSILLVTMELPRYSYELYCAPISSKQFEKYIADQFYFVNLLSVDIQKKIVVRISPTDYSYSIKDRWESSFPKIELDLARNSMLNAMKKSRIFISTYNATTYLESLALNFPTLIFWDEAYWELNGEAVFYFDKLEKVGIFHKTPESAALMLIKIWPDINDWWESREVQNARSFFCKKYSYLNPKLINSFKDEFTKIA
jgi:putative transferase (TIGR04331 family)